MSTNGTTGADLIVRRLRDHAVGHIFGYPGGQLTPLYDAIYRDGSIRHYLARDEQAAAFMADGYARACGKPGVCLAVCGPGVNNAITPLATAYTDSIPFLLISGQIYRKGLGLRSGYYHENEQLELCRTCTKWAHRIEDPGEIPSAIDEAMSRMTVGRPGPVLLEVSLDILREGASDSWPGPPVRNDPPEVDAGEVGRLCELLERWEKPLLLVGGGVISSGAEKAVQRLAERLGSPVFHTAMGKSALSSRHPLAAGMSWTRATSDLTGMEEFFSPLFREADGLLAIGCRFTQLATGNWALPLPASLVQIDVDGEELGRHYPLALGIQGDARRVVEAVLDRLPMEAHPPWTSAKRRAVEEPWQLPGIDLVMPLRKVLPDDAIVVADITRMAYIMMVELPVYKPRTFLHPAGYVSMGYGIPAALGARAAIGDRPIVAIAGDGCFLMSGMELATAVQEDLPVVVIVINDGSLTLIKAIQERKYENRFLGVDLRNPDFGLFAKAFGAWHCSVDDEQGFEQALREAISLGKPALLEVCI